MTLDELQDSFEIRRERSEDGTITVWSFPQDIVDNTRRAFNTDPTSADRLRRRRAADRTLHRAAQQPRVPIGLRRRLRAAADRAARAAVLARRLRIKKRFPFARKAYVELDLEVQNVFDSPNFNHAFDLTPDAPLTANDVFRVTSAYTDINTTYDPGGRLGQIVWRLSW